MLTKLSYSVTFPTTGRTLAGEFEFKPGFGLITGANEQGKSLIIEVVRWCLFGSSALRGKAEDYKTLKATLQFSARDQSYVVDRTFTTAKLMQGDAVLCSGTAPVNKHIPALLGFGLDVFDVACAANQGDIERLGNLRPAERKRMVDTVIGLDRLEEVARWAGEEARGYEKQVEAIERSAGQEPSSRWKSSIPPRLRRPGLPTTLQEVERYTRAARQAKLADSAMTKLTTK